MFFNSRVTSSLFEKKSILSCTTFFFFKSSLISFLRSSWAIAVCVLIDSSSFSNSIMLMSISALFLFILSSFFSCDSITSDSSNKPLDRGSFGIVARSNAEAFSRNRYISTADSFSIPFFSLKSVKSPGCGSDVL